MKCVFVDEKNIHPNSINGKFYPRKRKNFKSPEPLGASDNYYYIQKIIYTKKKMRQFVFNGLSQYKRFIMTTGPAAGSEVQPDGLQ